MKPKVKIILSISMLAILLFATILSLPKNFFSNDQVEFLSPTSPQNYQALLPNKSDNPLGSGEEISFVAAQNRLSFSIPQIESEEVERVWVSTNPENLSEQSIAIRFKSDLLLIIHAYEKPIDNWDQIIATMPAFKKIDVNGNSGIGADPGTTDVRGQPYAYPGSVEWWVNGLDVTLYSDTLSLEELLKIAQTIPLTSFILSPAEATEGTSSPIFTETTSPTP